MENKTLQSAAEHPQPLSFRQGIDAEFTESMDHQAAMKSASLSNDDGQDDALCGW